GNMPRVFLRQILWHSKDNKHPDRVYSVDWQPHGHRLATAGADEFVHIWCVDIKEDMGLNCISRLLGHEGEVNCVRWSPNGALLVSGGAEKEGDMFVSCIMFASLFLFSDKNVIVWRKSEKPENVPLGYDANLLSQFPEFWSRSNLYRCSDSINTLCWSPDGMHIAVALEDAKILILILSEGSCQMGRLCVLEGHTHMIQGIAWDPMNEFIVSQSCDQTVRVWNRKSDGKNWKLENVIKNAKDKCEEGRGNSLLDWESPPSMPSEWNPLSEKIRQNRSLYYPESILPSFFRRLDWSPDGTIFITPAGVQFLQPDEEEKFSSLRRPLCNSTASRSTLPDEPPFLQNPPPKTSPPSFSGSTLPSLSPQTACPPKSPLPNTHFPSPLRNPTGLSPPNTTPHGSGENFSVSYAFHRKLITVSSTPFVTQKSILGVPVAVRFNPVAFKPVIRSSSPPPHGLSPSRASLDPSLRREGGVSTADPRDVGISNASWLFPFDKGEVAAPLSRRKALKGGEADGLPSLLISKEGEISTLLGNTFSDGLYGKQSPVSSTPPPSPIHTLVDPGGSTVPPPIQASPPATTAYKRAKVLPAALPWVSSPNPPPPTHPPPMVKANPVFPKFVYALGTLSGQLLLYDTQCFHGPLAIIRNLHLAAITDLAWSNDGYCLAASSSDGYITLILFDSTELGDVWMPAQAYSSMAASTLPSPPGMLPGGSGAPSIEKKWKLPLSEGGLLLSTEGEGGDLHEGTATPLMDPSYSKGAETLKEEEGPPKLLRVGNAVL
ncbi:WD domain, G-beta repeat-containing protein, partial [Cardiosporidium cionae]